MTLELTVNSINKASGLQSKYEIMQMTIKYSVLTTLESDGEFVAVIILEEEGDGVQILTR